MVPKNFIRIAVLLLALFSIHGCATYKAVGTFKDIDQIMVGNVDHNLFLGGASFELTGVHSNIKCEGQAMKPDFIPNILFCEGQRGRGVGRCTDGRKIEFQWVADSCTKSHGQGEDSLGNTFYFTSGQSETEAQEQIKEQIMNKQKSSSE